MKTTGVSVLMCLSLSVFADIAVQIRPTIVGDGIIRPLSETSASAELGRQIFVSRNGGHCVLCHQVNGLDAPFQGNLGPALSGIGDRLSVEQIRLRIADASILNPQTIMPPYYRSEGLHQVDQKYQGKTALSGTQVEHLVAYLAQLGSTAK